MSKRDTDTEIWDEDWFMELGGQYMLFWFYLKDKCDHAGLWRPNFKRFEIATGFRISVERFIAAANTGKERVRVLDNGRWWLTGFCSFHYPRMNVNNPFHRSVINSLRANGIDEKSIGSEIDLKERSRRPQGEVNKEQRIENEEDLNSSSWRSNYEIYLQEVKKAYREIINDPEWIAEQEKYHPGVDIKLSLEKAFKTYWATEAGWKKKKAGKTKEIDWRSTASKALDMPCNKVWIPRQPVYQHQEVCPPSMKRFED